MRLFIGVIIIGFFLSGSMISGFLHLDPISTNLDTRFLGPSSIHIFGTDDLGRDVFARVFASASNTLIFSIAIFIVPLGLGISLGLFSLWSKYASIGVNFLSETLILIPDILLIFLLASFSGGGFITLFLIISIAYLPYYIKIVRSSGIRVGSDNHLLALRALGISDSIILTRHILPLIWPSLIVQTFYNIGNAILILATLGFLGIGLDSSKLECGNMINSSLSYFFTHPLPTTLYLLFAISASYSFNLIGEAVKGKFNQYGKFA